MLDKVLINFFLLLDLKLTGAAAAVFLGFFALDLGLAGSFATAFSFLGAASLTTFSFLGAAVFFAAVFLVVVFLVVSLAAAFCE